MNFKDYIIRDSKIRNGVPVIKDTDITLKTVLGHLFIGDTFENIIDAYPGLTIESLRAVVAYAAGVAGLDVPDDSPFESVRLETLTKSEVVVAEDSKSIQNHLLSDQQVSALLASVQFKKDAK